MKNKKHCKTKKDLLVEYNHSLYNLLFKMEKAGLEGTLYLDKGASGCGRTRPIPISFIKKNGEECVKSQIKIRGKR